MKEYCINRNIGQGSTISCNEVSDMSQPDSIRRELRNKIALAIERQINEQLYQQGAITKEMYEAAKLSLAFAASESERNRNEI